METVRGIHDGPLYLVLEIFHVGQHKRADQILVGILITDFPRCFPLRSVHSTLVSLSEGVESPFGPSTNGRSMELSSKDWARVLFVGTIIFDHWA